MYRRGFWQGINASNLYDTFAREERREAEVVPLLADYTRLLGSAFKHAQQDIRPYLSRLGTGAWSWPGNPPDQTYTSIQYRFSPTARVVVTTMRATAASTAAPRPSRRRSQHEMCLPCVSV